MIRIHLASQKLAMELSGQLYSNVVETHTCDYKPEGLVLPRLDGTEVLIPWTQIEKVVRPALNLIAQKDGSDGSETHGPALVATSPKKRR